MPTYFNFVRDVIFPWASQDPDALALWHVDENSHHERKFTVGELAELARRAAAVFSELGVRPGDHVLVILPRIPSFWISMLGLVYLGAVPIPGPTILTEKDIDYRIEVGRLRAILTDDAGAAKVRRFDGLKIIDGGDRPGWFRFDTALADARTDVDPPLTRGDDPGIIYFTSGTAGQPKMALHTQASYGIGHRVTGQAWLDLRPGDVLWAMADTGWAKTAWSNFFGPWQMRACVFVLDTRTRFTPASALRTLSTFPITNWCAPPTALRLIVADHELHKYRFPHLRHCVAAGEALNADVIHKWRNTFGLDIYEGYGQTETVILLGHFRHMGDAARPGCTGRPAPGFDLALLDEDLNELPAGKEGQIAIRIKPRRPLGLFQGYWNNPAENAARFRGDWYLTGDVAIRDGEGYYNFIGRADDVINSASYRIGPFEVESALAEHPAVVESAVVGAPDKVRGQIVKAYIVLKRGYEPTEALKHEIQEHCKKVTASYKCPRQIEFVAEMPKTISGKIRRVELREQVQSQP